ncbi:MAG: hypothetical protein IT258_20045 [Saprospiraceae bacterium]|nr:hypothetical protein [Saprospiraceae bacterium]
MKEADYQQFVQSIAGEIRSLQSSMETLLPQLEQEADAIISNPSKDAKSIEHLLDTLLDWQMMGVGRNLFFRLLEHYKTIDPDAAADYWRFYEDMTE